jgi:hypothetical protein
LAIENLFGLLKKNKILSEKWKKDYDSHNKVWVYLAFLHNRRIKNGELELRSNDFLAENKKKVHTTYFQRYKMIIKIFFFFYLIFILQKVFLN